MYGSRNVSIALLALFFLGGNVHHSAALAQAQFIARPVDLTDAAIVVDNAARTYNVEQITKVTVPDGEYYVRHRVTVSAHSIAAFIGSCLEVGCSAFYYAVVSNGWFDRAVHLLNPVDMVIAGTITNAAGAVLTCFTSGICAKSIYWLSVIAVIKQVGDMVYDAVTGLWELITGDDEGDCANLLGTCSNTPPGPNASYEQCAASMPPYGCTYTFSGGGLIKFGFAQSWNSAHTSCMNVVGSWTPPAPTCGYPQPLFQGFEPTATVWNEYRTVPGAHTPLSDEDVWDEFFGPGNPFGADLERALRDLSEASGRPVTEIPEFQSAADEVGEDVLAQTDDDPNTVPDENHDLDSAEDLTNELLQDILDALAGEGSEEEAGTFAGTAPPALENPELPTVEPLPVRDANIGGLLTESGDVSFEGSCPAPVEVTLLGAVLQFRFDLICQFASLLSFFLMASAWFMAYRITMRV